MNKKLVLLATVVGVVFVFIAIYYWVTPADVLPSFVPGFDPTMAGVHIKHGVAALILGLGCFVYAWFASAKKVS